MRSLRSPFRSVRRVRAVAAVLVAVACAESPAAPIDPPELPPLTANTWYVNSAWGEALPGALIAHAIDHGVLVQTFLDSAFVTVNANGTWQQGMWMRRTRGGQFDANLTDTDFGTWAPTEAGYAFTSALRGPRFTIADPTLPALALELRNAVVPGSFPTLLRLTRPVE
jgi:hypothetical protein